MPDTVPILWRDTYRLARVPADTAARLAALPGHWHLLVLVEDWCGDAVNTVPLLTRLAESDDDCEERGWWGPRPSALQARVVTEWSALGKDERYRQVRTWYARDRGRTTLDEVVAVLERAAEGVVALTEGWQADTPLPAVPTPVTTSLFS
jgi:Thioredoxin